MVLHLRYSIQIIVRIFDVNPTDYNNAVFIYMLDIRYI